MPNSADRWQLSGSICAISFQIGCWTISDRKIRELFNSRNSVLKPFNMQMTLLECYGGGLEVTWWNIRRCFIFFFFFFSQKEILRATDGVSGLIILSVDLCAVEPNCLSCNARNEQTNGVLSWKASPLGSASSITRSDRKSVWDDSLVVVRKLSQLSPVKHYGEATHFKWK